MSVERDPLFGCELATGRLDKDGYAFHGSSRAHIVAWERANGPVPEGKELDHLCRRRNCVALHHLEPVTRRENELRKSWRHRSRIKWCPRGHALELYAIVTPEGGRVCRRCNQEAIASDPVAEHGRPGESHKRVQRSDQNPSSVRLTDRSHFVQHPFHFGHARDGVNDGAASDTPTSEAIDDAQNPGGGVGGESDSAAARSTSRRPPRGGPPP